MKRRSKLIFSLISLCFSIAVLCFGVYSALSVSYSINGSVSYEINDVFVELDLSVYRALSTTPVNSATHNQNVSTIKDAGDNISETDFGKLSYTDHKSTYEDGVVKPGNEDGIFEADSPDLDLTYGSPTNDNQGYAFYIVIDIHNLGSEIINAQITAPTSLENTILRDSGNVEIAANGTERIVLGLALDDVTKGIISADFTYTITISRGELPLEEITDMVFSVDEATKTATLISYAGPGGDVVIPETIGYDTASSRTLTFNTMEDMSSDPMNEYYFYQDLYITLPNQEAQLIENPILWLNENMDMETGSLPEDYFPMTIQTVDSYTIDQEDYNKYSTLNQDVAMMVTIMPIQNIMQNMLLTSVDVQYGTEGRSFTFNMENYNAAMTSDESPTSTAIRDFMSKGESNLESLLPVTYSNFKYSVAIKGDEYPITSIGEDAFRDCSNLTSIEIPSSVTSIEVYAFGNCSALETVTFGANSQLENIGSSAFSDCSNLTSIEIPSGVTSIGGWVFSDCYALAEVYNYSEQIPEVTIGNSSSSTNGYLGQYAKVVYNPSDLQGEKPATRIQTIDNVQYYVYGEDFIALAPSVARDSLTTLTLDGSTTEINQYTFYNCSNLTSITIPSRVTSIGNNAFSTCSFLTSIEIPSSVTSIGTSAFINCYALAEVYNYSTHIPEVTIGNSSSSTNGYLGRYAKVVYKPSDLTGEKPATRIQTIGNVQYYVYGEDFIALAPSVARDSLTTLTLDSRTTEININAFFDCDALTSIEIPSSVTSIGEDAFFSCSALETITFGENSQLESIGSSAFSRCSALETVTFGENSQLASIGSYAFSYCSNLTSIEIPSSVTSIGSSAFSDTPWLTNLQNTSYGIATASDGQTRFAIDVPTDITDDELDMTNVRVIAGGAFTGCSNLTRIEIPSSMTSIGDYAFRYCDALETVTFEDSDSVWVVNNSSNTEITISEHTPQELADYLKYNYYGYTWTKNV